MPRARAPRQTRHRHPAPVSESLAALGERIRAARAEAGLSQSQLGRPHFTRAYISALELGKVRPSMKSMEFLAGKLGKPVSFFIQDEAETQRRDERTFTMLRAKDLIARGHASEAVDLLEGLSSEGQSIPDRMEQQRLLARALTGAGQPARAVPVLLSCLRVAESAADSEQVALVERQLAHAHYDLREFTEARRRIERSIELARSGAVKSPLHLVHCLQIRGSIELGLGLPEDAARSLEEALELGRDVADPHWLATVYGALGMARWVQGDAEGAIRWMSRSVGLLEDLKNMAMAADMRFNMAIALAKLGQTNRAREAFLQAIAEAERYGRHSTLAGANAALSKLAAETGNMAEARQLAQKAVDAARAGNDPWAEAEALAHFGALVSSQDVAEGDRLFQEAIAMSERRRLGNRRHLYAAYVALLESVGRTDEAGRWALRALRGEEGERGSN